MSWRENVHGVCPVEARGKRVKVKLRNGMVMGAEPVATACPAGWRADDSAIGGGPAMRWTLTDDPFDVLAWDFV